MNRKILITLLFFSSTAMGQTTGLGASVLGGGGGSVTDGTHKLGATIGQTLAGPADNNGHKAGVGFWYLAWVGITTSVGEGDDVPALRTDLFQNAPNPFNPSTTIRYTVGTAGSVSMTLYNLQGRVVAKLVDRTQEVGEYELVFQPRGLPSGTYIYRLVTADSVMNRRMVLLK